MGKLIAVVGMSGSGKGGVTDFLEENGWTKIYFGGVTYRLMQVKNYEPNMDQNVMLNF